MTVEFEHSIIGHKMTYFVFHNNGIDLIVIQQKVNGDFLYTLCAVVSYM